MTETIQVETTLPTLVDVTELWQMAQSQLRSELSRALFDTWVEPLRPLSFKERVFTLGAANPYARDWVESRLKNRIARLVEGYVNQPVEVQVVVANGFYQPGGAPTPQPGGTKAEESAPSAPVSPRKAMLQRAYGSRRAAVIQPERGMFLTLYFFNNWLPLLGHSAATIILAARSMCYWNPLTGELRNSVETDMAELASRSAVSLRTVKDVLAMELVQRYFLRYRVRRIMTPNGVRTAGILLQVRMDDPLTPDDQAANNLPEEEHWFADNRQPVDYP